MLSDFCNQALFSIGKGSQNLLGFDYRRPPEQVAIEQQPVIPVTFLIYKSDALSAVEEITDLGIGQLVCIADPLRHIRPPNGSVRSNFSQGDRRVLVGARLCLVINVSGVSEGTVFR